MGTCAHSGKTSISLTQRYLTQNPSQSGRVELLLCSRACHTSCIDSVAKRDSVMQPSHRCKGWTTDKVFQPLQGQCFLWELRVQAFQPGIQLWKLYAASSLSLFTTYLHFLLHQGNCTCPDYTTRVQLSARWRHTLWSLHSLCLCPVLNVILPLVINHFTCVFALPLHPFALCWALCPGRYCSLLQPCPLSRPEWWRQEQKDAEIVAWEL